ncbi:Optineurin [Armadillidium vulgare]|nr:Optineurin [Armadillidium vulgare]
MVHPNNETTKMGQAGLCTAPPQTDSPLNSGLDSYPQELISNGSSNDIINSNPGSPKFQELDNTIQELYQQLNATERKLQVTLEEKDSISSQRTKLEGELTLLRVNVEKVYKTLQKEREAAGVLFQELEEARSQVEHLESELKTARAETQKYKSKYQISRNENSPPLSPSLDSKLNDSDVRKWKDEAALLREEVETLEAALEEERKRTNEERATLNRIQGENLRLKKEINENRDRSEKSHYSDQYYQTKIKSIQEMHDEATAKLISYEELVGSKNEEIARLKKDLGQTKAQLMEMKSEGETIAVLRAQVEVYQSDFRAEREAREAMASDREKLREDLRHLQMRNTQLMDELEAYQRRHFSQGQGPSSRSASEEPKDTKDFYLNPENIWDKLSNSSDKKVEDKKEENPEVDENLLYCPKCSKSFSELRPLEEHVNKCLDED